MIAATTFLDQNQILIEALAETVEITGTPAERQTQVTGIEDNLKNAYATAKGIITTIAADFAESLKDKLASAQKVEIEFSLGLESKSGLWIISAKGECALKVKMTWGK